MAYDFYLGSCLLPVPPQKMQLKVNNQNKTMNLINGGEINILKDAGLSDISFEVELPNTRRPYAVYPSGFQDASYYLEHLWALKVGCKPFQLIVSRAMPGGRILQGTSMKVSLEDYQITDDTQEGFDIMVNIQLKQYKDYATKTVLVSDDNQGELQEERSAETAPAASTYTVQSGDCLWKIAKKYYNKGSDYTKIFEANRDKVTNPNLIYPGQELVIP